MTNGEEEYSTINRLTEEDIDDLESEERAELLDNLAQECEQATRRVGTLIEEAEQYKVELTKEIERLQSLQDALMVYQEETQRARAVEAVDMEDTELEEIQGFIKVVDHIDGSNISEEISEETLEVSDEERENE